MKSQSIVRAKLHFGERRRFIDLIRLKAAIDPVERKPRRRGD
jgi:hypothetical protein